MATCVVRDKAFMETSKRLGVHPNNLELVYHKHLNTEESNGKPLSDFEILKSLWGKPFVASQEQLNLYVKNKHFNQLYFDTIESATEKVEELTQYYPKSAVSMYMTTDNRYIVDVGTPMTEEEFSFCIKDNKVSLEKKTDLGKESAEILENYSDGNLTTSAENIKTSVLKETRELGKYLNDYRLGLKKRSKSRVEAASRRFQELQNPDYIKNLIDTQVAGIKQRMLTEARQSEDLSENPYSTKSPELEEVLSQESREKTEEKPAVEKLKPQYRGKLIYAQAGTGKSSIADNVTVFDSDYLLGQVLGVSPETAGFFFRQMSTAQKKAFGEQYRDLIRQKIAEGKTVLTANASMLNEADVVLYNQSPEQTEERVNRPDRALHNQYSDLNYHRETLEQIQQSQKENGENKEYIALDSESYIADHLLSPRDLQSFNANRSTQRPDNQRNDQRELESRLDREHLISNFLKEFGISVATLDNYNGELPLFQALNRVINAQTPEEITNGVGYAIAFMMQSDPEMSHIINMRAGSNKRYQNSIRSTINRFVGARDEVIQDVGNRIASELSRHFGEKIDSIKSTKRNESIWKIIKNFLGKLFRDVLSIGNRGKIESEKKLFVRDIVDALSREDFSRIKGPLVKPGGTKKAQIVQVEDAFGENPFEEDIISKLSAHNIALAGSPSIALAGTLFRPAENPLHDLDFNAGDNSSKASLDKLLPEIFGKDRVHFSSIITRNPLFAMVTGEKVGDDTVTYVTLDRPFEVRDHKRIRHKVYESYYDKDGKYLGKREGSELVLEEGVKGKLLDFFVGKTKESEYGFSKKVINGKEYVISNDNAAMAAKILWARQKDIWDYRNFRRSPQVSRPSNSYIKEDFGEDEQRIARESYTQEMRDILAKAPRNAEGKLLVYPGGPVSNLNERQYVHVRTKAFKEWFGDWEKFAQLNRATVIWGHPGSGKTYLFKEGRDDIIDFDSEYKVRINKIMGLPEGANAKELRVAARKARKQEYHDLIMSLFDEAVAEAKKTGKKLLVSDMMLLREREKDIDVITNMSDDKFIERSAMRGETDAADKMLWKNDINAAMAKVSDKSKIINTEEFLKDDLDGKNVSKVVDENGEPLVVYHGTHAGYKFNTFRVPTHIMGEKTGVFFTSDRNYARQYSRIIFETFLNIKNPKTGVSIDRDAVVNERVSDYFDNKKQTIDGLIGHDKWDDEISGSKGTEYVVFNPNQIKSATDNNGDYSSIEDNIYLQENFGDEKTIHVEDLPESITPSELYEKLTEVLEEGSPEAKLAKLVFDSLTKLPITFNKEEIEGFGKWVASEKQILLRRSGIASNTILHEGIHALTTYYLKHPDRSSLPQNIQVALREIEECYDILIDDYVQHLPINIPTQNLTKEDKRQLAREWITDNSVYGYSSPSEMIAELSNPEFVELIRQADARLKGKNIFQRLVDAVSRLFGINKKYSSVEVTVKNALVTLLTNPSLELFEKYSQENKNIKNNVRTLKERSSIHYTGSDAWLNNHILSKLPTNSTQQYADIEMELDVDEIPYQFQVEEDVSHFLTKSKVGTIINSSSGLYTIINGPVQVLQDQDKVIVPIRVLSPEFLTFNTFDVEEGENGAHYITNVKKLKYNLPKIQEQKETVPKGEANIEKTVESDDPYVKHQMEINKQMDNLLNAPGMKASEVRHLGSQIAWLISEHLTKIQKEKDYAKQFYPEKADTDFSTMSRADIVREIGPGKIMDWCRNWWFSPANNQFNFTMDTLLDIGVIQDNWMGMMLLAQSELLSIEKFSIVYNPLTAEAEVNDELVPDPDDFNSPEDSASIEETEGSQQEHWQIETKTQDIINTMTQLVKLTLMECKDVDENGEPVKSRFGIDERKELRQATQFILRNTRGCQSLSSMVEKLKEKASGNGWINQLIQRLEDREGKESDFQSQFYSTFYKAFQSYSIVRMGADGKYESIIVNENPALSDAMKQITTQFKINEHPLFTSEGVNESTYNELHNQLIALSEKFAKKNFKLDEEDLRQEASEILGYTANLLGYYVTPDMVAANLNSENLQKMYSALNHMDAPLKRNIHNKNYNPFDFKAKDGIRGNLTEFLKPIAMYFDDVTVACFYDSGKMYQSYTTPSYMTKLMEKFAEQDGQKFREFIQEEYGKYGWFRDQDQLDPTRGWKIKILENLCRDKETREKFKHKVQLNFDKTNYMKDMDDMKYTLSLITEFLSEYNANNSRQWSWYRMPMQSNKPSSEYIRMERFMGPNYKETITDRLMQIFIQELSRIQTVKIRNFQKNDERYIKNLDSNGKKFCYLDFLNEFLDGKQKDSELGKLINAKVNGANITADSGRLYDLARTEVMKAMEARAQQILKNWGTTGIVKAARKIANAGSKDADVLNTLENFIWNDTLAAMNIMELTITDIAYYKNAEDLQKRLAQLHAPGTRGNIEVLDYEGRKVTDGKERTFYLTDFETFVSNIVDNVSIVFDRKIEAAEKKGDNSEVRGLRALKDSLVRPRTYKEDGSVEDNGGAFWNINVADAQAYNSPTSYRKKALVFGKWGRGFEEIYQKLITGDYRYSDLKAAFQPLKPFVYGQIEKSSNVENAPLNNFKMGVQNKNSEYLLIMADAILQGEHTGKPNLLRAVYQVMEESHFEEGHYGDMNYYKTDGIDTVQFVSAVKAGEMGKVNLNDFLEQENGEAIAKSVLRSKIFSKTSRVNPETNETEDVYGYNNNVVHEISFEDYSLQQEVPEHFRNHNAGQIHGSQLRYIVVSELENFNDAGERVTYNIGDRQLSAEEFKKEYEDTIAANIEQSINELSDMLYLGDKRDPVKRNIAISKILQKEILSSPRYGIDLYQACSVDANGNFRIPLGDPIQSKRVEQLLNSIVKNNINKQKIAGGPVVQVSNFGTSKQLNIKFKDKSNPNGVLMTREEWQKRNNSQGNKRVLTTIAPYFNTYITNENKEKVTAEVQKKFLQRANEVAEALGVTISSISTNTGGFTFQEGSTVGTQVRELSYTFELNTDKESVADVFASIMGDIGHEQQEVVFSYNSVPSIEEANALAINLKINNSEGVADIIEEAGFTDYTLNETTNEIRLLAFSKDASEFGNKLKTLKNKLKDNYVGSEEQYVYSRYLDKRAREATYRAWSEERKLPTGEDSNSLPEGKEADKQLIKEAASVFKAEKESTYEDYIKKNQGGIAYFEVFAPMYADEVFQKFADKNGVISAEAIEMFSPELLKMIGYRIPTEAKYSMAPLKIVGFLPREAGDAIMLPYDITLLTGSDFDVDKEYLMRKEYKIGETNMSRREMKNLLYNELTKIKSQEGKELTTEVKRGINDLLEVFLSDPFDRATLVGDNTADGYLSMSEGEYKQLLRTWVTNRYKLEEPKDLRTQRNNKIVDMTYEVLTHENSAAEMLNPGGFDQQKRMGYLMSAARTTNVPWSELREMSIDELKDLVTKDKNLMYIDTHIQFYRQNSAAGSLIGIFAVHRTAHAVIENEGYQIDVEKVCELSKLGISGFTVADMYFGNRKDEKGKSIGMEIDVRKDKRGESVGKVLGSLVASAADAVKDPVLNLMNINKDTANILTTLVRLGMPFNDAALFLSQSIITKALNTLSKENLNRDTSLNTVVNKMITELESNSAIKTSQRIKEEPLTRAELVRGIKPGDTKTDYKVLKALVNFIKLAKAMRMPTAATRFNSISKGSTVGPLAIDNLMINNSMNELSGKNYILDKEGNPVEIEDILKNHPILEQFHRTLGIANDLLSMMPAGSTGFQGVTSRMFGTNLSRRIMGDRRLLGKLSDFYQSYLAVAGGVINSTRVADVITKFPKEFMDNNYKEKYNDNALIQSIRLATEKSGRPILKLDTTGLDIGEKERLGSGWADLHKVDPELSLKLFEYCFFRGGIGFNPKTFMNLVPIYVKERIPRYIETFNKLPFSDPDEVIDQFVRHNWNERGLLRRIDVTRDKDAPFYFGNVDGERLILADSERCEKKYKLGVGDYVIIQNMTEKDILGKLVQSKEDIGESYVVEVVEPLGDNGEYLEISVNGKVKPMTETDKIVEEDGPRELTRDRDAEIDDDDAIPVDEKEEQDLLYKIYMTGTKTEQEAKATIEKFKARTESERKAFEKQVTEFLERRGKEILGIELSKEQIIKLKEELNLC